MFFNYQKPGRGVSKDEPEKTGVALYFQLYFRHFSDFAKENIMYVVASLPAFFVYYFLFSALGVFFVYDKLSANGMGYMWEPLKIFAVLTVVTLCGTGPASSAMAYMMRCVTRESHCFLFSDFVEKFKENFKTSIVLAVTDVVLLGFVFPVSLKFYLHGSNTVSLSLAMVLIVAISVYVMMHIYFYQFAVTFELSFLDLLKNSFLMVFARLPYNLLILAIPVLLTYLLLNFVNIVVVLVFAFFFLIAFMRYPIEFFAARTIQKNFLEKGKNAE